MSKIDVKKDTTNHNKPEKINMFNGRYIEYKSKGGKNLSIEQYLEKI